MDKQQGKILFVDDDDSLRMVVPIALARDNHIVDIASDGYQALELFKKNNYDLVIQDIRMPKMDGIELLNKLKKININVPIIVMTAFSTWDIAVDAMRLGAFDYIKKPFDNNNLRDVVQKALSYYKLKNQDSKKQNAGLINIIGSSPGIQEILSLINKVASTDTTVVIQGESGTGKELVARMLHIKSHRRENPFIAVNCGGLSETLLESELFGHVKGAFTGAISDKKGLLELANRGTFFLDEVGEMTLSSQVRLLRALETKTFTPVGSEKTTTSDVRFVTATNRDLQKMVEQGTFRQDLYYRMNIIPIYLPALRERKEDIPLLAGNFLAHYAEKINKQVMGFDKNALAKLMAYDWPGNIRELQNTIQRAVSLTQSDTITEKDLSLFFTEQSKSNESTIANTTDVPLPSLDKMGFDLEKELARIESFYIQEALRKSNFSLTQAADLLGISFRSIRYKIKKLNIE